MKRFLLAAALWLVASPAFAGISCSLPFNLINGITADATQVMANYNALVACLQLAAHAGNNTDITSISGLTTPLPPAQGGSAIFAGANGVLAANNYTVATTVPANYTLQKGYTVVFVANAGNTGPVTLTVGATGPVNIYHQTTTGPAPLTGLEIAANDIVVAVYDGAQYQLIAPIIDTGPPTVGGRIVAATAVCTGAPSILLANVTSAGVLCYVPYLPGVGNLVWINGANFTYTTLTVALDAVHQTAGNLYDVFAVARSGAAALCIGGNAWATPTPTGPSSINAPRVDGLVLNANGIYQNVGSITNCWNNGVDFGPIAAGGGTYLGTIYANTNGTTIWNPSPTPAANGPAGVGGGPDGPVLGVYNAYNQVIANAFMGDSGNHTGFVGNGFWQNFGASLKERINYVDGIGTSNAYFVFTSSWTGAQAGVNGGGTSLCIDGVGLGAVNGPTCLNGGPGAPGGVGFAPTPTSWETDNQVAMAGTAQSTIIAISEHWISQIGFHFAQALWVSTNTQKQDINGGNNGCCIQMKLKVPM